MTVAVLDNGICADELKTPTRHFCVGSSVERSFEQTNKRSHGTVCAKIIEKFSSVDLIFDVTFIGEDGKADISDLTEAIEFCLNNNVDVINLSCGIEDYTVGSEEYRRLYDTCKKVCEKKIKIFAAQNNIGRITIPAAFPFVVSVEQKDHIRNRLTSIYRKSNIYTNGKHLIRLDNKYGFTEACNSFACAYATAKYSNGKIKSRDQKDGFEAIDDKTIKLIKSQSKHYPKADIPVIYIEDDTQAAQLAAKMKNSFSSEKYNADILSSNKNADPGAFYVPEECLYDYINLFAYFNDNDVVIVITNELLEQSEDVGISFKDGSPVLSIKKGCERVDDYNVLFNKILDYYSAGV